MFFFILKRNYEIKNLNLQNNNLNYKFKNTNHYYHYFSFLKFFKIQQIKIFSYNEQPLDNNQKIQLKRYLIIEFICFDAAG